MKRNSGFGNDPAVSRPADFIAYAFELKAQADGNGRQIPTTAPPLPYKRNARVPHPAEPATPIVGADPAVVNPLKTKPPAGRGSR